MDSIVITLAMLFALIGGGAWFYLKISNTRSIQDGIENIGSFFLLVMFCIIVVVLAFGFMVG